MIEGIEVSDEKHFSWRGCGNCGQTMGNEVYNVIAHFNLARPDRDYYDIQLCPDCILQYYYGETDKPENCKDHYKLYFD